MFFFLLIMFVCQCYVAVFVKLPDSLLLILVAKVFFLILFVFFMLCMWVCPVAM